MYKVDRNLRKFLDKRNVEGLQAIELRPQVQRMEQVGKWFAVLVGLG